MRVPRPDDHRRVLAMLGGTPVRLRRLVEGLDGEAMRREPAPGEWSAAAILQHLLAGDREAFLPRLRRMLAEAWPVFEARPERASETPGDPTQTLAAFQAVRGEVVALLERLDGAGWLREGMTPSRGRLSVEAYAASMAGHDREHLLQLSAARVAYGLPALRCEAGDPMPFGEILATLAATPDRLLGVISGLPRAGASVRPGDGQWSIKEVTAHLLAVEERLFLPRLQAIRDQDWPRFPPFDPDAWAAERDWREGDVAVDVAGFNRTRTATLSVLRGLVPADLDRGGVTSGLGGVTLHEYATHVAEHDLEHLSQIEALSRPGG